MNELRFDEELYDGFAIDEAVKVYADFATVELSRADKAYVVRVSPSPEALARGITAGALCAELANYALGKTIERSAAGGEAK